MFFNVRVEEGKSRSGCEEKILGVRGGESNYGDNYLSKKNWSSGTNLNTSLFANIPSGCYF